MRKEQYDNFRQNTLDVQHWQGGDIAFDIALIQLVDNLRTVARAAKLHVAEDAPETWDNLWAALDVLPPWVLEENNG